MLTCPFTVANDASTKVVSITLRINLVRFNVKS